MLHIIKHGNIHLVCRTELLDQIAQSVILIIFILHFQNGLFQLLAQADHRLTNQLIIPIHLAHQPRVIRPGQFTGRTFINNKLHVRMHLQECCRNRIRHSSFHGSLDNRGFLLSPRHQNHSPGLHDRPDTHRNGFRGYQIPTTKILYRVFYRQVIQKHLPSLRRDKRARLVKTDMPRTSNTQYLQVDSPSSLDLLLVIPTEFIYFIPFQRSVRDMNILRININMIKQMVVHEIMVALLRLFRHRQILVQIEGNHVTERNSFFPVHSH